MRQTKACTAMDHGVGVKSLVNEWQVSGLITNWITARLSQELSPDNFGWVRRERREMGLRLT